MKSLSRAPSVVVVVIVVALVGATALAAARSPHRHSP